MKVVSNSVEMKKGAWTPEEDQKLISCVKTIGSNNWTQMPKAAGLARSGKSCRFRWVNYLRPELKRGRLTMEEKETIMRLQKSLGNKWSQIAAQLPGRTDNEIKNFWNLYLKKPSKTVQVKNPCKKIKETKRSNKKCIDENTCLSYATHELYSENSSSSSMIIESSIIDFPIAESYSPSKDNDDYSSSTVKRNEMVISSPHQESNNVETQKINVFEDNLWVEDVYNIPEIMMDFNMMQEQDFAHACTVDGLTSFWLNTFMEASGSNLAL